MDGDGLLTDLDLWLEVLVVGLNGNAILEPDGCYLDRMIIFEASRLCVQCVEIGLIQLLESLLPLFKVFSLSIFLFYIHLAESEALLFSIVVGCLS